MRLTPALQGKMNPQYQNAPPPPGQVNPQDQNTPPPPGPANPQGRIGRHLGNLYRQKNTPQLVNIPAQIQSAPKVEDPEIQYIGVAQRVPRTVSSLFQISEFFCNNPDVFLLN